MNDLVKLQLKNIFSVDTRGKPMNRSTFYNQISKNLFVANKLIDFDEIYIVDKGEVFNHGSYDHLITNSEFFKK